MANIDNAQVVANVPNTRAELEETVPYSRISAGGGACLASLLALALVSAPLSANAAECSRECTSAHDGYDHVALAYAARQSYADAAAKLQRVSLAIIAIERYDNLLARVEPLLSSAEVAVKDVRKQLESRQAEKINIENALATAKKAVDEARGNRAEAEKIQQGNRTLLAQIEEQVTDPANKDRAAQKSLELARESVKFQLELSKKKKQVASLKTRLGEARKALERLRKGESSETTGNGQASPNGSAAPEPSIPAPPPLPNSEHDAIKPLTPEQDMETLEAEIAKLELDIPVADKEFGELATKAQKALDDIDAANMILRAFEAPDAYKQMVIRRIAEKEELLKQFYDAENKARAELASAERRSEENQREIAQLEADMAQAQARVEYYSRAVRQIQERRAAARNNLEDATLRRFFLMICQALTWPHA